MEIRYICDIKNKDKIMHYQTVLLNHFILWILKGTRTPLKHKATQVQFSVEQIRPFLCRLVWCFGINVLNTFFCISYGCGIYMYSRKYNSFVRNPEWVLISLFFLLLLNKEYSTTNEKRWKRTWINIVIIIVLQPQM